MKSLKYLVLFLMIILGWSAFSQPGSYYPPPANVLYHNDTLTICPPDSLPGDPVILVGYNIYVDSAFFDNVPVTNPADTLDYIYTFPALPPGDHSFCANAVYNQWISDQVCDSATVIYGYELPFLEDWLSGSFEELKWTSSSGNWVISNEEGNPAPAAEFRGDPVQTNYAINLESYPINTLDVTIGKIWLDYYLRLDNSQPTGNEQFRVQVWDWVSRVWRTVAQYSNSHDSQAWPSEHINIKSLSLNKIFRIRFQAIGVNSDNIQSWKVDNIHIYRACDGPSDLELNESWDYNQLNWTAPADCCIDTWLRWDMGYNYGISIGTGGAVEFDVAARWTPSQLTLYHNCFILNISFFPAEAEATYKVRIWQGDGPDTMLVDQLVPNPEIGTWNVVTLTNPRIIDITKELWVGYHVSTPTGYPAGVDAGPAIDGFGNMMYYDSAWQTLLEINPDLNFNWNIACLVSKDQYPTNMYYRLYRKSNEGEFLLYDITTDDEYQDTSITLSDHYCYQVTLLWIHNYDTCESNPTNTVCETVNVGIDQPERDNTINIYPNPAKNWLNIESEEEIRSIRIYNLLGEEVLKFENGNLEARVGVSLLQSGIYYVKVTTIGREYKAKIVILR